MRTKKDIERMIKNSLEAKRYNNVVKYYLELASFLIEEQSYNEATKAFKAAKEYAVKIPHKDAEDYYHEFQAYRGIAESFAHYASKATTIQAIEELLEYVKATKDYANAQIALHVASFIYSNHLNDLNKAEKYALQSLQLLENHSKEIDEIIRKSKREEDDSERRKAGICQVLANIYEDKGDIDVAREYCLKALSYNKHSNDHEFRYILLNTQRRFVNREKRLDISCEMLRLCEQYKAALKKELAQTHYCVAEDYLIVESLNKANDHFWKTFDVSNNEDEDLKEKAKNALIVLYKLTRRLKRITAMIKESTPDYLTISKIYEKCADEVTTISAYDLALKYYFEMLKASQQLPGDSTYGDLKISRGALVSLAETCTDLQNYAESIRYYQKVEIVEYQLGRDANDLAEIKLNIALNKQELKEYNFEEKLSAFKEVKFDKHDKRYVVYLTNFIEFLEANEDEPESRKLLNNLRIEHQEIEDSKDDNDVEINDTEESYTDDLDEIHDFQIIKHISNFYAFKEECAKKRNRINHVNEKGESDLHLAAKHSLEEVKLFIDKCGYKKVINKKDYAGWTALSEAVSHGQYEIVKFLIDNGANVNTSSSTGLVSDSEGGESGGGQTPLMEACTLAYHDIAICLLKAGAKAEIQNANGWTAGDYLEQWLNDACRDQNYADSRNLLKCLRELEKQAGLVYHEKRPDLYKNESRKSIRQGKIINAYKSWSEMYADVISGAGRKRPTTSYVVENAMEIDRMSDDEEMDYQEDDFMNDDDREFRKNAGFDAPSTFIKPNIPSRNETRKRKRQTIDLEDEDFIEICSDEENAMVNKKTSKRKSDKKSYRDVRESSVISIESNSSKKTKCSSDSGFQGRDDNDIPIFDFDSASIGNKKLKEIDLSFSNDVDYIIGSIRRNTATLTKIVLKGSDFDDDIDEIVQLICGCKKLTVLDLSQVLQIEYRHANEILQKCSSLKHLDLYGTTVTSLELKETYVLEKLILAKNSFLFDTSFYSQVNSLQSLTYLDVSHTAIQLDHLLVALSVDRPKLHIKALPISYFNIDEISKQLSKFSSIDNITIKISRHLKDTLLSHDSDLWKILV